MRNIDGAINDTGKLSKSEGGSIRKRYYPYW